jgi:metal transporter CNNM
MNASHSSNTSTKIYNYTASNDTSCCTGFKCLSADMDSDPLISTHCCRHNFNSRNYKCFKKQQKIDLLQQKRDSKSAATTEKCDNTKCVHNRSSSSNNTRSGGSNKNFTYSFAKALLLLLSQLSFRVSALPIPWPAKHEPTTASIHAVSEGTALSTTILMINISLSALLVVLGGIFAGLTLGLMGQDEVYLKVIQQSGETARERNNASTVLALLKRGKHWVLVTLLLSNVITNESLPIVLDRCLGGGWPAILSSTVAIVIFGEIIPQSLSVRYGLGISAAFAPFVLALMYALYPLAYPVALLLDVLLGQNHGTVYKRAGLKTLVGLHKTMGVERLNEDEVTIISAVLDLKDKPVRLVMTPIEDVFTMPSDRVLDEKAIEEILHSGFNRIPVHAPGEPTNFIGMLLVRTLITYDPEAASPISAFPLATLPETRPETSCLNILNYFQEGKSHMIVVSNHPGAPEGAQGVLTLEDVIEELIGEEIIDEFDVYIDVHRAIKRDRISNFAAGGDHHPSHSGCGVTTGNNSRVSLASVNEALLLNPADGLRLNPLNMACCPKHTSNSKVTIKIPLPDDYFREHELYSSQNNSSSALNGEYNRHERDGKITDSGGFETKNIINPHVSRERKNNHNNSKSYDYSSSMHYRNGIIESIVNVHGVAKTIIEEDSESDVEFDGTFASEDGSGGNHSFKLRRSSNGSKNNNNWSYMRRTPSMSSSSSSITRVGTAISDNGYDDDDESVNVQIETRTLL